MRFFRWKEVSFSRGAVGLEKQRGWQAHTPFRNPLSVRVTLRTGPRASPALAPAFKPVFITQQKKRLCQTGANMRSPSEESVPLHEEFIYCCGAATHVLKCGPWKDLSKDESKNLPRLLFMIIPGNPGLAGYYRTFIQALYCGLNQQYPVWVVSHAGHCKPPSGMEMIEDTDIKELEDVFGLNGQVEHKLNFLKKNVSKDIKLVLIAHSIGCYITLEMMKRASELQRNIEK
ncbi:lipid droplet-associated hydrolase-like isoform X2 [Empidonax traillii]|uniref:lipid droplet-associated hydrolase-like isoform X2 n=1 Tax=Empidonax traillii TaxID=164674 RepID=UPI000FFD459B|nr:lipid droplet-associated hydrolase-like isoform X2 [Empidonax traillii]